MHWHTFLIRAITQSREMSFTHTLGIVNVIKQKKKSVFVCSFWLMGMISSTNTALLLIVSKSHSQHEQVDYSSVT